MTVCSTSLNKFNWFSILNLFIKFKGPFERSGKSIISFDSYITLTPININVWITISCFFIFSF